jgi:hypothetical protein
MDMPPNPVSSDAWYQKRIIPCSIVAAEMHREKIKR